MGGRASDPTLLLIVAANPISDSYLLIVGSEAFVWIQKIKGLQYAEELFIFMLYEKVDYENFPITLSERVKEKIST